MAWSPDGKLLARGSWDNTVKVWDVGMTAELASGSEDETVIVWDPGTGCDIVDLDASSAWRTAGKFDA